MSVYSLIKDKSMKMVVKNGGSILWYELKDVEIYYLKLDILDTNEQGELQVAINPDRIKWTLNKVLLDDIKWLSSKAIEALLDYHKTICSLPFKKSILKLKNLGNKIFFLNLFMTMLNFIKSY